jgi:hypothetical protein
MQSQKYKSLSKYELAACAGIQWRVFRRWLKTDKETLQALGYTTSDKILNPAIVQFLCQKYAIDLE